MKHYCPMCGEQWDDDFCMCCGWHEGKQARYTVERQRFPYGMNADDHAPHCEIRTSRDGWDADCTCGVL